MTCVPGDCSTERPREQVSEGREDCQDRLIARSSGLARTRCSLMGEGADIGAAVAYLASKEEGYITGQTLHVNGGMAMLG